MDAKPLDLAALKPALNATLVTDRLGLDQLAGFFSRVHEFGWDTETNVVPKFVHRKMRTMQFGDRNEQYVIDLLAFAGSTDRLMEQGWKKTPDWAKGLVEVIRVGLDSKDHLKVGANLQFDYETTLWCLGLRSWNYYDCQLVEKVIHAGQVNFFTKGFYALDDMVERYCRLKISKSEQKSFDLETPLTQSQIEYAALDTRFPLAVKSAQAGILDKAKLHRTAKVENDAIPAFGEMHLNGVLADRDKWMSWIGDVSKQHTENVKALDTHFVPVVGSKADADKWTEEAVSRLEEVWRGEADRELRAAARKNYQAACKEMRKAIEAAEKWEGEARINYGATGQLLTALRTMGFGVKALPNTNDKTLAKLSDKAVIRAIQDYRETSKLLSTYGESWLEAIDPDTGRVHSSINQMGAETGRTSSSSPNIQNLPKLKACRACFVSRKGRKIVGVDMAGAELRIMADDSGDEVWIVAFENDWDLHSIGAEMAEPQKWAASTLEGCAFAKAKLKCECPVHKKLRDDNKSTNFGVAYGMEEAALAGKLRISKEEAGKKLTKWRKVNAGVHNYLVKSGDKAKMDFCAHDMIGRRRLFNKPDWTRAAEIAAEREAEDAKKQKREPRIITSKMIGRVYHAMLGSIEREGKNMRVQGTNATIAKLAMGCGFDKNGEPFMWHLLPKVDAELQNFIHDEVVTETDDDKATECAGIIKDCFLRAGAEVLKRVKMLSEEHIADCWQK